MIEEAVVVFNERTAAKGKFIGGFSEVFCTSSERFQCRHENGAFFNTAKLTDTLPSEFRTGIVAVHAVGKLKGHKADARLEACISEEHVHEFCHFSFDGVGTVGDDGVVGAGVRFFQVFNLADDGVFNPGVYKEFVRAFYGLFHSDAASDFFRFGIVACHDPIGGGKAGGVFQCVI